MPKHKETKHFIQNPDQLFDLISDVEKYPQFLPWVLGAKIKRREENIMFAELIVGFKMIKERYTSKIILTRPGRISVENVDGPFKHLYNIWEFKPCSTGGTIVEFDLSFEFNSFLLSGLIGGVFSEATRKMVKSFEERANKIYGTPKA